MGALIDIVDAVLFYGVIWIASAAGIYAAILAYLKLIRFLKA